MHVVFGNRTFYRAILIPTSQRQRFRIYNKNYKYNDALNLVLCSSLVIMYSEKCRIQNELQNDSS